MDKYHGSLQVVGLSRHIGLRFLHSLHRGSARET